MRLNVTQSAWNISFGNYWASELSETGLDCTMRYVSVVSVAVIESVVSVAVIECGECGCN
jgi:hypothetical protein